MSKKRKPMRGPFKAKGDPHKRWFWRIRHRVGEGWREVPESLQRRWMRQWSWRRAL